jgi:hypothetical protein
MRYIMMNKKGQGSFLGGDIPAIIMIVIRIAFFLSSITLALNEFNSRKVGLSMEAALVDAASSFLKENAKLGPEELTEGSDFWDLQIAKIEQTYGVNTYVKIECVTPELPGTLDYPECGACPPCDIGECSPGIHCVTPNRSPMFRWVWWSETGKTPRRSVSD